MRLRVRSLASLSGLTIRRCRELRCRLQRLQTRFGSHVAVALAQAGGYSSDWTPSLGTSICRGRSAKKTKKKKKKKRKVGSAPGPGSSAPAPPPGLSDCRSPFLPAVAFLSPAWPGQPDQPLPGEETARAAPPRATTCAMAIPTVSTCHVPSPPASLKAQPALRHVLREPQPGRVGGSRPLLAGGCQDVTGDWLAPDGTPSF